MWRTRERGWVTTGNHSPLCGKYQVNMAEALNSDIASYATFNDFFTRALKPGARPLAQADPDLPRRWRHQPVWRD